MEEQKQKLSEKLSVSFSNFLTKGGILNAIICLMFFIFTFLGTLYFEIERGKSLTETILSGSLNFVVNVIVYNTLLQKGYIDGKNSHLMVSSKKAYAEAIEKNNKYLRFLPMYCLDEYKERIRIKQISLLKNLDYNLFKKGVYRNKRVYEKLTEKEKEALEKAENANVFLYSYEYLLANNENDSSDETKKNVSLTKKTFSMNLNKIGSYFIITILLTFVNFSFKKIDIANIIFHAFMFILWVIQGLMGYYKSFNFIIGKYRNVCYIEKTNFLEKFYNFMENNPNFYKEQEEQELKKLLEDYQKEDIIDEHNSIDLFEEKEETKLTE